MSTNKLKLAVPALLGVHGSRAIRCLFLNLVKKKKKTTVPLERFVVRVPIERLFLVVLPWQRRMARRDLLHQLAGERAQRAQHPRMVRIRSMQATTAELNAVNAQLMESWALERAARWRAAAMDAEDAAAMDAEERQG